jgi:peroxiredoxin
MIRALGLAALLTGCVSAAPAVPPVWERPGFGGAVRPEMGSPQPGEAAPDLVLPDGDGHSVSLSSLRGSWVVMHFTATWCPFCDSEVQYLGALAEEFAPRGVKTLIVDVEEDENVWRSYATARVTPSLVALRDASGANAARFAPPRAQPSFEDRAQAVLDGTLIIDPAGIIRLFLLPDSAHFDPTFRAVREELGRLVAAPVVTVGVTPSHAAPGERGVLAVRMEIAPGYHVMSDRPSAPTYIATRVTVDGAPGIEVGPPAYPAPTPFALGDRAIATFQGAIDVRLPIDVAAGAAPGTTRLHGVVRYQACTASLCLFPVARAFVAPVVVGGTAQ